MPDIILTTFNARYQHAAFGLRYLLANLGGLRSAAALVEFDLQKDPEQAARELLALAPRMVGLGVYVWNVRRIEALVTALHRAAPELTLVLGGPEVSAETAVQPWVQLANFIICGEADLAFADLCRAVLAGQPPPGKILCAAPPDPAQLALPYDLYSDHDLATRLTYLEASRGCPFGCEYCVSSIDRGVRRFAVERLLPAFEHLLARGVRRIKFVDRTFNLDAEFGRAILELFYAHAVGRAGHPAGPPSTADRAARGVVPPPADLQVHLEIAPACLTPVWRELLRRAPPNLLRLEVGVQTFDEAINARIGRQQTAVAAEDALRYLREETGALIHADLIAGLPGQTLDIFGADFDRMIRLGPHEIQVGILKRLRGTAIGRHDAEWGVRWNSAPPYDLLANRLLDAVTMERLKHFARFWDVLGNRGRFVETLPLLWSAPGAGPFAMVWQLSQGLFSRFGKAHSIPLLDLAAGLFEHMTDCQGLEKTRVAIALRADLTRLGVQHLPKWLRDL